MNDKEARLIMREFSRIRKERDRYSKLWLNTTMGSREFKIYKERCNTAQKDLEEMAELRTKAFAWLLTTHTNKGEG